MSDHVLLIGWAGATERHLRGLSTWYAARGASVQTCIPTVVRNMSFVRGWERAGRALARSLRERAGARSIVVHSFSNAGFWTWVAAMNELAAHELARVRAVILDSAPGIPDDLDREFVVRFSTRALMPQLTAALGRTPALTHPLLDPILGSLLYAWTILRPHAMSDAQSSLRIARRLGGWPHLLLYGGRDELVAAELVEAFGRSLAADGRSVRLRGFPDSEHVRHLFRHREAYLSELAEFLGTSDRARSPAQGPQVGLVSR